MKRVFGLIGYPLEHSWSRKFFNQKFENESIENAKYENFAIEDLSLFRKLVDNNPNLVGLNVTIPYKERIIPYLDELDATARGIGAVNTIKVLKINDTTRLVGFNTDVVGFESSLINSGVSFNRKALVLGSGGASKAVRYVLEKHQCQHLVVSRTPKETNSISYAQITEQVLREHTLVINTTPLGMFPKIESFPEIPYELLSCNHVLYDLVYNPIETSFLKKGKEAGTKTINGLEMLELQAIESWKIWNSTPQD